ncbi:hypothetical protein LY90DRAFT_512898 [Neocallimastix californiae]|uniref:Uncharacterized protein n=1 Tax=Neocallimastix californiae TaxID=1754190 RepID=A0A1Y2B4K4_9FUNG|nr:hypothetical protein LY90DRAFT_512898 [Neocallimastix californiae]|eukprot:ORY29407.1 hypothetical protein LY90DRAFT_512898 [Neocallimastix californiae]
MYIDKYHRLLKKTFKTCSELSNYGDIGSITDPCVTTTASLSYCFDDASDKIYGFSDTNLSCVINTENTFAFEDSGSGGKFVTLGSDSAYDVSDANDLFLFKCGEGGANCAQTYGYALVKDVYYTIPKSKITDCTTASVTKSLEGDCSSPTHYCLLSNDGKIYGYDDTTTTCAINTPGVYVFEDEGTNSGATLKALGTDTLTLENLMLYQCSLGIDNALSCSRTYGYIYDSNGGTDFLALSADGSVESVKGDIASNTCTSEAMIGKLQDTNKLCLFGKADSPIVSDAITAGGQSYIMNNVEGNIFTNGLGATDGSSTKSIVIKNSQNIFSLVFDDYDYCIDSSDNTIIATFQEFCQNNQEDCTPKAECKNSICTRSDGNNSSSGSSGCTINVGGTSSGCTENGYYLTDGAESGTKIQSEGSEGYLFQCTGSNGVTCVAVPQASLKIGYYLYANESNKYIKCTDYGHCSVVDVKTSATGCNDVNGSDPKYSVGDIINNGTNDVLCLDISVATGIIIGTQASYFADKNSIFHSKDDEYVLINATTDHTVVLSDKVTGSVPKYIYTDENLKTHARTDVDKSTTVCVVGNIIIEFKHEEDDASYNYYKKHVTFKN